MINDATKLFLHTAIELAQGFGKCQYRTKAGDPYCVAGQYVALRYPEKFSALVEHSTFDVQPVPRTKAESKLVTELQGVWDRDLGDFRNANDARLYMHFLVEAE